MANHVEEAETMLGNVNGVFSNEATAWASLAQAHATLALVEQQRIANLIALDGGSDFGDFTIRYGTATDATPARFFPRSLRRWGSSHEHTFASRHCPGIDQSERTKSDGLPQLLMPHQPAVPRVRGMSRVRTLP